MVQSYNHAVRNLSDIYKILLQEVLFLKKWISFLEDACLPPTELKYLHNKFTSGKRMLAGGDCDADGCTPAKPLWSEVIIFLDILLR